MSEAVAFQALGEELDAPEGESTRSDEMSAASKSSNAKRKKKKKGGVKAQEELETPASWDAVTIAQIPNKGRGVVALKQLGPGDIAFIEAPWALAVSAAKSDRFCGTCCGEVAEDGINAAPFVSYCCTECASADEAVLRTSAAALRVVESVSKEADVDINLTRMLLQLLVRRYLALGGEPPPANGPNAPNGATDSASNKACETEATKEANDAKNGEKDASKSGNGTNDAENGAPGAAVDETAKNTLSVAENGLKSAAAASEKSLIAGSSGATGLKALMSLVYHSEQLDPAWAAAVALAADRLLPLLPANAFCASSAEAVTLAARVVANAHGLSATDGSNTSLGFGMFPLVAMINHSCRPNCAFVFRGGSRSDGDGGGGGGGGPRMEVRLLERVAPGEELSVSYIDLLQSTQDRKVELLKSRHFECRCARCLSPSQADRLLAAYCCAKCGPEGLLVRASNEAETLANALSLLDDLAGEETGRGAQKPKGARKKGGGSQRGGNSAAGKAAPAAGAAAVVDNSGNEPSNGAAADLANVSTRESESAAAAASSVSAAGSSGGGGGGSSAKVETTTSGSSGGAREEADEGLVCCSCQTAFSKAQVAMLLQQADSAKDAAQKAAPPQDYHATRRALEAWLSDFDAGTAVPVASNSGGSSSKKGGKSGTTSAAGAAAAAGAAGAAAAAIHRQVRLSPSHAFVLSALVVLANCCRAENDHAAACRHMRRIVLAMELLYPPNLPELADFRETWAESLYQLLSAKGATLPKKMREQACRELVAATAACASARAVCYGADHPNAARAAAARGQARALVEWLRVL